MLETLPGWFWAIYYFVLLTTLVTAIYSVVRKRIMSLSIFAIIFTITVPIISLLNSIGRAEEMNEFEHLISQLQQGAFWSIFTTIGYLFLLVWWFLYLFKSKNKKINYDVTPRSTKTL